MPVNVEVATGAELDALMTLRASAKFELGVYRVLNGVPFDYHGRAWWYREMGLAKSEVALRRMDRLLRVAVSVALSEVELLDRLLMSGVVAGRPVRRAADSKSD